MLEHPDDERGAKGPVKIYKHQHIAGQLEDVIIDAAYFAINKRILMGGASIA